jgi:hypothetical protein
MEAELANPQPPLQAERFARSVVESAAGTSSSSDQLL